MNVLEGFESHTELEYTLKCMFLTQVDKANIVGLQDTAKVNIFKLARLRMWFLPVCNVTEMSRKRPFVVRKCFGKNMESWYFCYVHEGVTQSISLFV